MVFNNKETLYEYLNNFNFNSKKQTQMGSVYFLIKYNDTIEPIYFFPFENVWFESPCEVHKCEMTEKELLEYVHEIYVKDAWDKAYEFEKLMLKNGYHHEIDCPQCSPFLPDDIEILDVLTERECLEWIIEHWNK